RASVSHGAWSGCHLPASATRAQARRRRRGGRAGIITGMSANPHRLAPAPALRVDYTACSLVEALEDPCTLAAFAFGSAPETADPRALVVPLAPLGDAPVEAWRVPGQVTRGRDDAVGWAHDG